MDKASKEPKVNRLFLAMVVIYILFSLFLSVCSAAGVNLKLPVALSLISGELILLVPTVIYVLANRADLRTISEHWRLRLGAVPLLILMAYCLLPAVTLINLISMLLAGENAASSLVTPIQQLPMWASLLCVSVLPGVAEEFIFRGLLYSQYRRRRVWGAIVTSALLFGLMHMNLNQFCYAFVIGIFFCLVYEGTGTILASMLMHAVYNGNSVVMMYLTDSEALTETANAGNIVEQAFGTGAGWREAAVMLILIAIVALIGLVAAGGLYAAVVKICGRTEQVKLLFCRDAKNRRRELAQREGKAEEEPISGRIWGLFLWIGVFLSILVILWELLLLKMA